MLRIIFSILLFISLSARLSAQKDSLTVYLLLSETCPICQSVSIELKDILKIYRNQGIGFLGVFPSKLSNEETRKAFANKYGLSFSMVSDTGLKITNRFSASTTPEAILLRESDGQIIYRGLIDNSFVSIGKRRRIVTERYLYQSLLQYSNNESITIKETKPVGCIIQK